MNTLRSIVIPNRRKASGLAQSGVTLLEMMVAVALLTVIMLGLTTMFLQTQKAFKGGLRQADISEGARSAMSLITRDLQQMSDAGNVEVVNFFLNEEAGIKPLVQSGIYGTRTNVVHRMYNLSHTNKTWSGIDYKVFSINGDLGIGTLSRCITTTNGTIRGNLPTPQAKDYRRVADGVVHFRVRAYDTNGWEVLWRKSQPLVYPYETNVFVTNNSVITTNTLLCTIPSYLEVELGIIEPEVLEQVRALGDNADAVKNFLDKRMSKVHMYRQQVPVLAAPIRNFP